MAQTKVEITAEDKTAAAFRSAERNINAWSNKVTALQGVMAGVATGALVSLINKGLEFADTLDELSKKTSISTTKLQELHFAGTQLGAKSDDINEALLRFTRTIGDAALGSDQAREALGRMGITIDDLKRKSVEQLFDQAQRSMAGMSSETQRLSVMNDVFSRTSKQVANLLSGQTDEMELLRQKAHELGAVMSSESIAKAKETKDKFEALSRMISVQLSEAVVAISPLLTKMAGGLSNLAQWGRQAAIELGMLKVEGSEAYDQLLIKRMQLADMITSTEEKLNSAWSGWIFPGEARKQMERFKAELTTVDAQLAKMRETISGGKESAPIKPAVDRVEQSARDKAEAKEAELRAKRNADNQAKEDQRLIDERLRLDQHYADRLARIEESFLTEDELQLQRYEEQLAVLEANFELGRISQEDRNRILEEIELQHQARMGNISAQGALARRKFEELTDKQKLQNVLQTGVQMTEAVATSSKTMFKINKSLALANAAVTLPDSVLKSWNNAGGYPWGIIPAGLMLAAGLAQINQIKSAQFGSSTSAPSIGGGGAIPVTDVGGSGVNGIPDLSAQTQAEKPGRVVNIMIDSDTVVSGAWIRDRLIPELNDAIGDGVIINVSGRFGLAN